MNNAAGEACSTALAVTPRRKLVLGDLSNAIKDDEEIGKTNRGIRWVVGERLFKFHQPDWLNGKTLLPRSFTYLWILYLFLQ